MESLQPDLPPAYVGTRQALHRVAEELVAPARKPQNEIALRQTPGGFGTPPFGFEGETVQVRVDGTELIVERGGAEKRIALASLAAAGAALGPALLPDGAPMDDSALELDRDAGSRLADFFAFSWSVLEEVRSGLPADADVSEVNLWPEHFDAAFEAGPEAEGGRANLGASPCDEDHDHPYLYVGPWDPARASGELWNATGFKGAELSYARLTAPGDQRERALEFFRARLEAL